MAGGVATGCSLAVAVFPEPPTMEIMAITKESDKANGERGTRERATMHKQGRMDADDTFSRF